MQYLFTYSFIVTVVAKPQRSHYTSSENEEQTGVMSLRNTKYGHNEVGLEFVFESSKTAGQIIFALAGKHLGPWSVVIM